MTNEALVNYLIELFGTKRLPEILGKALPTIHAKIEKRIPWSFDEVTTMVEFKNDTVVLRELASRVGCFVVRPDPKKLKINKLTKDTASILRKLTKGKRLKVREAQQLGEAFLALADALSNKAIQQEIF